MLITLASPFRILALRLWIKCLVLITLTAVAATVHAQNRQVRTKEEVLVYESPALTSKVLEEVNEGETLTLLTALTEEWVLVSNGKVNGYVLTGSIEELVANESCKWADSMPVHADSGLSPYDLPGEPAVRALAEISLLDFNNAVRSRDFYFFHATIADVWKPSITPAAFEKGFAEFLALKPDISSIQGEKARFVRCPRVDSKYDADVLFLDGIYQLDPLPVRFNLEYVLENDQWKLVRIRVSTKSDDIDDL